MWNSSLDFLVLWLSRGLGEPKNCTDCWHKVWATREVASFPIEASALYALCKSRHWCVFSTKNSQFCTSWSQCRLFFCILVSKESFFYEHWLIQLLQLCAYVPNEGLTNFRRMMSHLAQVFNYLWNGRSHNLAPITNWSKFFIYLLILSNVI